MRFHHVGTLVKSIDEAILNYKNLFGNVEVSGTVEIQSQKVKVCFLQISESGFIELVEPIGPDSAASTLARKNATYYHIGYKVTNIEDEVRRLESLNYKPLEFFKSEAFQGKKCIFLFSPDAHLIELIED